MHSAAPHPFSRPQMSRKRSNSVPSTFGLVNVTSAERLVLCSAAERATARRRRPVSVDSPGPVVHDSYDQEVVPRRAFHFSTPSRQGIDSSAFKHARSNTSNSTQSEDEATPRLEDKPLPPPPPHAMDETPIVVVKTPSIANAPHSPPTSPISPRRQVVNPNLKAYADGLFVFTQSRLNTAAPRNLNMLGHSHDLNYGDSPPPTPELEAETEEEAEEPVTEMKPQRPVLQSSFSDWSATNYDSDADRAYISFSEPRTPEFDTGLLSPDSFFNVEVTPRVIPPNPWATISSARPSSGVQGALHPLDSPKQTGQTQTITTSSTTSDSFSYFSGFDSVTASNDVRFSQAMSPLELLTSPYTPARTQPPPPRFSIPIHTRNQPTSSASDSTPFYRISGEARWGEMADHSRPPSWLIRAIA